MRERLILAAAALAAFGGTLAGGFHFDDFAIFSDPALTSPSGWWQVWRPLQTRPLTYFTFWANYRLGGHTAWGYHAVNVALHVGAVLALWAVLRRLIPPDVALAAACLFAIHPMQAEAVAYVWARGTLLMTLFCLLALRDWLEDRPWRAVAWFGLALLAKEECVAFPLVLVLLHYTTGSGRRGPVLAMLGLAATAGARGLAATALTPGAPAGFQAGIAPGAYLLAQGPVIWRYARLLALPWGFTVDPAIAVPPLWLGVAAWLALLLAVLAAVRWAPKGAGFWLAAGIILLLPSSSVFPAADLAADRRIYLPLAALAVATALAARRVNRWAAAAALAGLVVLSVGRTLVWNDGARLWEEAVRQAPGKLRPKIQLARALAPERAVEVLREARKLAPDDPAVASETGMVWLAMGRPAEALAEFGRALALAPGEPRNLNNRGAALLALGQRDAARQDFERSLAMGPCLAEARDNLRAMGESPPPVPCP